MMSWELIIEQLDWGTWELEVWGLKLEIFPISLSLILTILGVSIFIYRLNSHPKQRVNRLQQKARKKWLELYPIHATPYEQIAFLSILLRRIGHPSKVVASCFVHCVKRISRNDCQILVSGKQRSAMNETTVHYFCWNMKGATNCYPNLWANV
jgi:hypothetical protein